MELARSDAESSWGMDGLVAELLSALNRVEPEDFPAAIENALHRIGERLNVDLAMLIEFASTDSDETAFHWVRPTLPSVDVFGDVKRLTALMHSLGIGSEPIILERIPEQLPRELLTGAALSDVQRMSTKSAVIIPVTIPGQSSYALAVGVVTQHRSWPERLIEGLRLLAEILTAAWQRRSQELALRQSRAEIARLSTRPETDGPHGLIAAEPMDRTFESVHVSADPIDRPGESIDRTLDATRPADRHRYVRVSSVDEIVGDSPALRAALARLDEVTSSDSTVLLLGETGTGKELFAKVLHARSPRRHFPLVSVNCAALPPTLIESELFGHERGAFTGAVAQRQGRFEMAHRGTLFLDEIGDLPLDLQAKLLRVLQEGEFERLGTSRTRKVDVRIVAATHRDLEEAVADGTFRDDLYYRLNVFPVRLPPLRERREDIPALVWYIIRRRQSAMHRRIDRVPPDAMEVLQRHSWPGNIRELENVIERALIHSTDHTLVLLDDDIEAGVHSASTAPAEATTLSSVERAHIEEVLRACGWRINGVGNAAERLGMHPNTLRFRMKKLGIVRAPNTSPRQPLTRLR
jgi:transcriptional regulator with GAF, ATPase, and Fis domain